MEILRYTVARKYTDCVAGQKPSLHNLKLPIASVSDVTLCYFAECGSDVCPDWHKHNRNRTSMLLNDNYRA